jgi:hypothetical protein
MQSRDMITHPFCVASDHFCQFGAATIDQWSGGHWERSAIIAHEITGTDISVRNLYWLWR